MRILLPLLSLLFLVGCSSKDDAVEAGTTANPEATGPAKRANKPGLNLGAKRPEAGGFAPPSGNR